ncbi:hypothetical protein MBLNU457_4516t1 [Dothideomycetes sp. NU457]
MAAEQRKLLEQLMGDQLMSSGPSRAPQVSITDPKVCRSYIVGTCPHSLFTNTKNDLGICPRVHSEALKTQYENADEQQKQRWGFEFDYLRDMARYIDDCNRKIHQAQSRLEKTPDEIKQTNVLLKRISEHSAAITNHLLEIQVLCSLSQINTAVTEHFKMRQAMAQKNDAERELKALSDTSGPSGHQKLQVCDVCGAYLSRLDNDRRLADHFFGKMHLGYAQMRKTHDELKERLRDRKPPPRDEGPGVGSRDDRYGDGGYGGRRGGRGGGGGGYRGGRGGGWGGQRW